jgi:hypothetical protein
MRYSPGFNPSPHPAQHASHLGKWKPQFSGFENKAKHGAVTHVTIASK